MDPPHIHNLARGHGVDPQSGARRCGVTTISTKKLHFQGPWCLYERTSALLLRHCMPVVVSSWKYEPPHDKTNKMTVRPAKTQISLGIRPVWSESSLCAQWVAKDPRFLHADSEDSVQTGRMPRLISVFAGRTCHFVGMSWGGSIMFKNMLLLINVRHRSVSTKNIGRRSYSFVPQSWASSRAW